MLYIMIVGKYPFDDPSKPNDIQATIRRVVQAQYYIPSDVNVSGGGRPGVAAIGSLNREVRGGRGGRDTFW